MSEPVCVLHGEECLGLGPDCQEAAAELATWKRLAARLAEALRPMEHTVDGDDFSLTWDECDKIRKALAAFDAATKERG